MNFVKWVKSIQPMVYNGPRTVLFNFERGGHPKPFIKIANLDHNVWKTFLFWVPIKTACSYTNPKNQKKKLTHHPQWGENSLHLKCFPQYFFCMNPDLLYQQFPQGYRRNKKKYEILLRLLHILENFNLKRISTF